jgi:protein required for attachment to host cells
MSKLRIPHDAFVFVGDGRKALFLRNEGDEKFPNLKTERDARNPSRRAPQWGTRTSGYDSNLGNAVLVARHLPPYRL